MEGRDGEKGPLVVEAVKRRVVAKIDRKVGAEETLGVIRTTDEEGAIQHDYHLSNAPAETPLREFARVTRAARRIEECIRRSKSEPGMADYQVRTWVGWHHHITLSIMATWFLVQEARRGKKRTPAMTVSQIREALAQMRHAASGCDRPTRIARERTRWVESESVNFDVVCLG